jgi:hypothetical protein
MTKETAIQLFEQKQVRSVWNDEEEKWYFWSGLTTKQYKNFKDLKKENLRDHMTNLELVLNMLAEASTTEISKDKKPKTFNENKIVARKGGNVAKAARRQLENTTGKKVVTKLNAKQLSPNKTKEIGEE